MRSLRSRLLAGLLGLALAGMLLLGAITYVEQRSFLLDRVDQQTRAAIGAVDHALDEGGVPGGRMGVDGSRGGPPGGPGIGLPPGTYGQRRNAAGHSLGAVVMSYGQKVTATPKLPAPMPVGRLLTVDGSHGAGTRYRALAVTDDDGAGTTIAAVPLREVDQTLQRLLLVEGLVIAGVLALLGAVAWAVVRIGLLPLDRIAHTAGAIAGGDLSQRVAATDPRTEVGRLGVALNGMLDRLEAAFAARQASEDRLRRFLADASHELRTPLASIRGYAELFGMGAVSAGPETDRALRRIEAEAARMGVLVENLLTLARLDEVPAAPHAEVDLAALARDAIDDARATAPDREVRGALDPAAAVRGDAAQLRQVLANLLRNALVHTPAGTPIDVELSRAGDGVRLVVRDHGPGLPTAEADALFERFWRSEGGRERGRDGAGLGLAIVAAIVAAHGGRVRAEDAPGGGAAFVVELPAAPRGPEKPAGPTPVSARRS